MGKGPAFAHKIREMKPYVQKFRCLPEHKKLNGAGSLLDNEAIAVGVCHYLAEQKLGAVSQYLDM